MLALTLTYFTELCNTDSSNGGKSLIVDPSPVVAILSRYWTCGAIHHLLELSQEVIVKLLLDQQWLAADYVVVMTVSSVAGETFAPVADCC